MKQYDWGTEDRYLSNNGCGPLVARITHVSDGMVYLRYKHKRGKIESKGQVKASLFFSNRTGWRKST